MRKFALDILKWAIIITLAAVAFYIVYPKYYFIKGKVGVGVYNKITGEKVRFKR